MVSNLLYHKIYSHPTSSQWVVFVHGAGGSSSLWFKQIKAYKRHFNLLLIDLRGHGQSSQWVREWMTHPYTFDAIAQDVLNVLRHCEIAKAHFVAMSLGTIIVRKISELAPDQVQSMVLGGAVIRFDFRSQLLVSIGRWSKHIIPYMWLYRLFAYIVMPSRAQRESRLLFIREAKKLCQKEFKRWYRLTAEVNPFMRYFREKDEAIPTLYLMGDRDYLFLSQVRELVTVHRQSELIELSDCGHVCNIEQAERFNHHSIHFIRRFSPRS
ncbi:alpha/beta fold hydrolase [Vibrio porteresiae]|uniref:Alpha/beta hydrolase n=1 Tax=Vibrio porteresiae DSM 19223 TaxID=1123496 RepID=A0ABZ0Q737_9VIBR|nr:alpha/beta hydrolase [Vibrio porteresiae]WPC72238.1 alpha/beta hydrolase [Vibrio porteresiae DSM 19223]